MRVGLLAWLAQALALLVTELWEPGCNLSRVLIRGQLDKGL